MTRQYVTCKFRAADTRAYTYHNDGEPVHSGDEVKVMDKSGVGWKRVYVADANAPKPEFDTKPILGLAPPIEEDNADKA